MGLISYYSMSQKDQNKNKNKEAIFFTIYKKNVQDISHYNIIYINLISILFYFAKIINK